MKNNENKINKQSFRVYKFSEAYEAPKNKIKLNEEYITWGDDNKYPDYILDLFNHKGSSTHKSIINRKVKLVAGQGFDINENPDFESFVNKTKLKKEIKKAELDYELFNAFALEVIWSLDGSQINKIKHIPISKIRIGVDENSTGEFFWYCNDWSQHKKEAYKPIKINTFDNNNPVGKQLYVHYEYNPSSDTYSIPGYSTSINWIEMDYEISKFHLNQVKQGYSPSFILNFATGIPTDEEMDEYYKEFKKTYSGADNSGKIIITYSEGQDGKPEFIPVPLNNSDEKFVALMEQIENNIVRGAEIPPQLVILTPGKLGSTDERKDLLAEFQATYIDQRQETIEEVLNEIFFGQFQNIKLKKYSYEQN